MTTKIVALLDRSGSMYYIAEDTAGGFDSFLADQAKDGDDVRVTLAQFDHEYELVYADLPIAEVPSTKLSPRGGTALLDALGRLINSVDDGSDDRVIFVVMTDGQENQSTEYTKDAIKQLVNRKTEINNWQFIFMGANIDAVTTGMSYGFDATKSLTYGATRDGVTRSFAGASGLTTQIRNASADTTDFVEFAFTEADRKESI